MTAEPATARVLGARALAVPDDAAVHERGADLDRLLPGGVGHRERAATSSQSATSSSAANSGSTGAANVTAADPASS
jgi:hypothetical protein